MNKQELEMLANKLKALQKEELFFIKGIIAGLEEKEVQEEEKKNEKSMD